MFDSSSGRHFFRRADSFIIRIAMNVPEFFSASPAGGVFALNKARGETSAKAAAAARKMLAAKKAGHGGALDPLADGLVVVLLGFATSLARFALGGEKTYRAVVRFGFATSTDDAEGEQLSPPRTPDLSALPEILPDFIGEYQQDAPRHSALKHHGRPLYYYARRGLDAPVKRRTARVFALDLLKSGDDFAELQIRCASGFYVRSLARDLGERLQCGGHLSALTRMRSGGLSLENATSLAELRKLSPEERSALILPPESVVSHLPLMSLPLARIALLANGVGISMELDGEIPDGAELRLRAPDGRFAGVGRLTENKLSPLTMMPWTREREKEKGREKGWERMKRTARVDFARKEHRNDERTAIGSGPAPA